jgi:DNA-binding GntR family transcriptional regulator
MSISLVIEKDLAEKLATNKPLPFKLTLSELARFYQVSMTPVRQAIDKLIEKKLLIKDDNGRLRQNISFTDAEQKRIKPMDKIVPDSIGQESHQILTVEGKDSSRHVMCDSSVESRVKQWIIHKSLAQHDGYLREEATASYFKIGRTMMRQIFSRMAGEGLVEHIPRCGWKVHLFRKKDMLDYLEIREMLELKALRLARDQFNDDELKRLLELNNNHRGQLPAALDNQLHHYWIDRCDNRYIKAFFSQNSAFYTTLFDYAALGDAIKPAMIEEHRAILLALLNKDWSAAEHYLIQHIRDQMSNVEHLITFKSDIEKEDKDR